MKSTKSKEQNEEKVIYEVLGRAELSRSDLSFCTFATSWRLDKVPVGHNSSPFYLHLKCLSAEILLSSFIHGSAEILLNGKMDGNNG